MTYIQTASGRKFDVLACCEDDILIEDIAHALSNICRFFGHTPAFYSVAQHCVEMSWLAPPALQLDALLHDASEAYLGDVSKHIKQLIGEPYAVLERNLTEKIARKFGLVQPLPPAIKELDGDMLETEFQQIWRKRAEGIPAYGKPLKIVLRAMDPTITERIFLERYHSLRRR